MKPLFAHTVIHFSRNGKRRIIKANQRCGNSKYTICIDHKEHLNCTESDMKCGVDGGQTQLAPINICDG